VNAFLTVLGAVLPVFCMTGVGVALRKLNWLTEEADQSLLRVCINLLLPCLIFESILGNQALNEWRNLAAAPLVGFGTVLFGMAVAYWAGRRLLAHDLTARRTFAFSVGLYNYGYIPLPLALLLYDRDTVGVLFVHNVGGEIAYWTLGILLLTGRPLRDAWSHVLAPPLIAVLLALACKALGLGAYFPGFLTTTIHMLGQAAIPLGLVLTGAIIADHVGDFHAAHGWPVIIVGCVLRLLVLPICFLLLARCLPVPVQLKQVMVLQAAMPSAVSVVILAKHYRADAPTALRVLMATSALSLITIPLWLRFGASFVGLPVK
jgi:predicted permease